jgi:formylmethanofuran dehydrogenase subunit E
MKAVKNRPTLDETLRPIKMTCSKCGGEMTVYPCPIPEGTGVCPNCSPKWLDSFAQYLMN